MARVRLIGTVETKRAELAALAEALAVHGLAVDLQDISLGAKGAVLPGSEKLARMAARGAEAGAEAAARAEGCLAAIGMGGGTGAEIALHVLRALPADLPKLLVTTLAFDPRDALADCAVTLVPTLCDIEGMNPMLARAFATTAAVLANHGTIGVGKTLMAAQYLAEIIEETAHIDYVRDTLMAAHGKADADLPRYGTAADARAAE